MINVLLVVTNMATVRTFAITSEEKKYTELLFRNNNSVDIY